MKINIYHPKFNRSRGGYEVIRPKEFKYGDKVYSTLFNRHASVPGSIVGYSRIQVFDRPGWCYDVRLCTGNIISANQYDLALLPPGWPDFLPDPDDDGEDESIPGSDDTGGDF